MEVSEMSRSLKEMAKDLKVPIVVLSQLSRAVEQRVDKEPQLSDLRDSGAIEQDADSVMMIYREEYYDPDTDKKGATNIFVRKNRN
jgi:replicative DNA helicase